MKKIEKIDINNWKRRDNYLFFKDFLSSWYTVTSNIECTNAFYKAKERKESFFIYYLYAILKASNEIEEFKYRIDKEGNIILIDKIDIITPISNPGKTFITVRIPYHSSFFEFYDNTKKIIESINPDSGPYDAESHIFSEGIYDVIHLSALPGMSFTSITFSTYKENKPAFYPLSIIGKAHEENGKIIMPYSIYVDHALIDGEHLSLFFQKIEDIMKFNC